MPLRVPAFCYPPPERRRLRAERYEGERFLGVGRDNPKASDHCPVVMALSSGA
ncbi:MAG: hypothetical protein M3515_07215 [Actinomycetota bacterium]|nr:hypothetical protein [Actinomycetota bacterium]